MKEAGIEVIFDDREASPGFKFSDCDLMGIPIRVVISPRSLERGEVELQTRDGDVKTSVAYDGCIDAIRTMIRDKL